MRVTELREMAMHRRHFVDSLYDAERHLNVHLIEFFAFRASEEVRRHWEIEIDNWFEDIRSWTLKGSLERPKAKFYYDILFEAKFGEPSGRQAMAAAARSALARNAGFVRNDLTDDDLLDRLRSWHQEAATALSTNQPMPPLEEK